MQDKITVRMPSEIAQAFETFLQSRPDEVKTRQDAMRYILRDWLIDQGFLDLPPDRTWVEAKGQGKLWK